MCGIVGAVCERDVYGILIEGLKRLEYRGYDSAGLSLLNNGNINTQKTIGKVVDLENLFGESLPSGTVGIAHTRWATHGVPSSINSHPHTSGPISVVHNGIIENHNELRKEITEQGIKFSSNTDSEVIAHLINLNVCTSNSFREAVTKALLRLNGAYAICVISKDDPGKIIGARSGSPLVVGLGIGENFMASDQMALRQVTDRFVYLEEGDIAEVTKEDFAIFNQGGVIVERDVTQINEVDQSSEKGEYKHFMEKEIYEQPEAVINTLNGRVSGDDVLDNIFGLGSSEIFKKVKRIQIVACGTSLHAGRVAANWFSAISELPTQTDYASEYRYRNPHVDDDSLLVTISQSGETADTLAGLRYAKGKNYLSSLCICNVPTSSLARESDYSIFTNAGPEIGVASTKAFTTQLVALMLLALSLAKSRDRNPKLRARVVAALRSLPETLLESLKLRDTIVEIAPDIATKDNALFLGRGIFYPIAKEGALKLKEISYIHAEAYPAGELKHGPLALIDENIPVIAMAPDSEIAEKLVSNLEEVKARGGILYVFSDPSISMEIESGKLIKMPKCDFLLTPIIYTIPLQILSYEVALLRGTDIDQPRNLAKSVTVE